MIQETSGLATAEAPAPIMEAERSNNSARPHSVETICVVNASPRSEPKALPEFPNPAIRPAGLLPPLVFRFESEVPRGIDLAQGRHPRRDTAGYVRAIDGAGNRSIQIEISCAGGEFESAIAITRALLKHPYSVTAKISRCSSAAAFIALAGDNRAIEADGSVLIHRAARICTPAQFEALRLLSADDKAAINEQLNDIDDATTSLLKSRLGVSEETAKAWMREDRKWSAAEALQRGFVEAVLHD